MSNTAPSKNENSSSAKLYIKTSQDDDNVTPYNAKFGYGPCQPDWLQCCNSAKWLTVHVGAFVFLAGMQVTGLKAAAARPLEKQFGFTSTEIGIMAAMYDVGAAIFGFIFSFFAAHTHKGKWVATGSILMAIGSMIIASPHFIYGRYQYSAVLNVSSICDETVSGSCTSGAISSSSVQLIILSLGQLISGMGSTIIWTIAYPYLDENVSPTASPIYIGVFGALASLGPGAGYLLGGAFLNFFVDWPTRPTDINSSDPQWVGAWWFGYVLSAILMAMTAVPLLAYPKHLPEYEKNKEKRAKIAIGKSVIDNNYGNSIKELPKAVKELVTNKVFLFVTLGATTEGMTVGGLSTFVPKYLQTQMNISSSRASFLSGILVVIGAASGMQLGGVVVRVKRLRPVQIAKFCYSVGIAGIFCALLILFNCPDVPIAGVTKSYLANNTSQSLTNLNLVSGCNGNCNCYISNYDPVCGIDGISYASPCYAGCSYSRINGTSKYYYSCSCISKGNTSATMASQSYDAVRELCPNNCKFFIPVLIAISLS
ncbi:Solute carrier organic anion transporter family member 4A1, partial [Trichoplax sp. H2]